MPLHSSKHSLKKREKCFKEKREKRTKDGSDPYMEKLEDRIDVVSDTIMMEEEGRLEATPAQRVEIDKRIKELKKDLSDIIGKLQHHWETEYG